MASTLANGNASSEYNASNSGNLNAGRQSVKTPVGVKAMDAARKHSTPSSDTTARRNNTPKAWQSGVNPITQRATTPSQPNGVTAHTPLVPVKSSNDEETGNADRHAHDRLLYILGGSIGSTTTVVTKSGDQYTGIFFGADLEGSDSSCLLKMVQRSRHHTQSSLNGTPETSADFVGTGDDFAMSFYIKDVVDICVENVTLGTREKLPNGNATQFRTDSDISASVTNRERTLQRWEPDAPSNENMTLGTSNASWDQFRTNEEKFNVKSDYDESVYTTRIDKSHPRYRERELEAQRMAREIEGSVSHNSHEREERGQGDGNDGLDEEQKYSGVHRLPQDDPNKYTPPARRPPSGQPGVPGVPVDPAIISSEISSTDGTSVQRNSNLSVTSQNDPSGEPKSPLRGVPTLTQKGTASKRQSISPSRPNDSAQANATGTKDVERKVLGEFKDFANSEKIKYTEARRNKLQQDKQSKINDLMKFAKSFKLQSEVPKDLVPILAKDPAKQDKIMRKARQEAEELAKAKQVEASNRRTEPKTSSASPENVPGGPRITSANERADYPAARHRYPQQPHGNINYRVHQQGNPLASPPSGPGGFFDHRQQGNRRQQQTGAPLPVLQPIPPPGGPRTPAQPQMHVPGSNNQTPLRTPTSALSNRFNPAAHDFKPNPGASNFQPTGKAKSTGPTQISSPSAFFGAKKAMSESERPNMYEHFNILTKLKELAKGDPKAAANGGIKPPYATPPRWVEEKEGEEPTSYKDMQPEPPAASDASPHRHVGTENTALPHQYQLPLHLQQGSHGTPHLPTTSQAPFSMQNQQHGFPNAGHHDEHRMQYSTSNTMYPSPRMTQPGIAYQSPAPRNPPMYGPPGAYVVGPGPGQPHYVPQFVGPPHMVPAGMPFGAPLMAPSMSQQGSQQGYGGPPQGMAGAMYTPPVQHGYPGQVQAPGGYPSPGRMTSQMMRQNSRQGQQQQMYASGAYPQPVYPQQGHMVPMHGYPGPQPPYGHSPQQHYQYPGQPMRNHSGYGHPVPGPPQLHQHHPAAMLPNPAEST